MFFIYSVSYPLYLSGESAKVSLVKCIFVLEKCILNLHMLCTVGYGALSSRDLMKKNYVELIPRLHNAM